MRSQVVRSVLVLWVMVAVFAVRAAIRPDAATIGVAAFAACGAAVLSWWSLRRGRHVSLDDARARTLRSGGIVLWKPGCAFCERLLRALRHRRDVAWVNVWADPAANRLVRELNDGNELTPTAVVGEDVLRNPTVADLIAALDARGGGG